VRGCIVGHAAPASNAAATLRLASRNYSGRQLSAEERTRYCIIQVNELDSQSVLARALAHTHTSNTQKQQPENFTLMQTHDFLFAHRQPQSVVSMGSLDRQNFQRGTAYPRTSRVSRTAAYPRTSRVVPGWMRVRGRVEGCAQGCLGVCVRVAVGGAG
jgi:hypothetical protein